MDNKVVCYSVLLSAIGTVGIIVCSVWKKLDNLEYRLCDIRNEIKASQHANDWWFRKLDSK